MNTIELFNPREEELLKLEKNQLDTYLTENNLSCEKLNRKSSYVVFDKGYVEVLEKIKKGDAKLIRAFKGVESLCNEIVDSLNDSEIVVFEASKMTMRNFYTLSGFVSVMEDVANRLQKGKVCLPPGCYGAKILFAVCR
ncbi:hypothetical protein [Teredinibacter sp. KSP-S5-2]|uniref:hypothetical protein n=1 Tax=Teredinibacter sp. KSP-S5-2 TaxID=3034506 RepID=UPI002934BE0D|nr:hypothetical protein [Teredinibacter sp. KSP-S5-2]WNO11315.1 hypothetical protein P5V12_09040 [Teredinibacter sp. KSP-S5-2]